VSSFGTLRIPQIDVTANFKTSISSETEAPIIKEDPNLSSTVQADGTYISVQPRTILMQVLEKNSVFEKENFDIEVYVKETEKLMATSVATSVDSWIPLKFKKKESNIVDGILVDLPAETCQEIDSTSVEYWFDIFTDKEISDAVMSTVQPAPEVQSLYLSADSPAIVAAESEIADIYSQVVPDDACPVDPCADKTSE